MEREENEKKECKSKEGGRRTPTKRLKETQKEI